MEHEPSGRARYTSAVTLSGRFSSLAFIVRGASDEQRDGAANDIGPEQRSHARPAATPAFDSITCVSADASQTLAKSINPSPTRDS